MMKMTIPLPDHTKAEVTEDGKIIIEFDEKETKRDLWLNQFAIYLENENEKIIDSRYLRLESNKRLSLTKMRW